MKIRAMQLKDMEEVVGMMRVFYDSPAVIHAAPDEILRQDVKDCVGDCPYIEGYIFEENDRILGYSMVAKSYSTEYGGICVWVEDLYMKEEARGLGIGTAFFSFLDEKYKDQAVRFRLEVEEENERAVAVYKKAGYPPSAAANSSNSTPAFNNPFFMLPDLLLSEAVPVSDAVRTHPDRYEAVLYFPSFSRYGLPGSADSSAYVPYQ